eukprot:9503926-Pyramimonas_sp.AAC.1
MFLVSEVLSSLCLELLTSDVWRPETRGGPRNSLTQAPLSSSFSASLPEATVARASSRSAPAGARPFLHGHHHDYMVSSSRQDEVNTQIMNEAMTMNSGGDDILLASLDSCFEVEDSPPSSSATRWRLGVLEPSAASASAAMAPGSTEVKSQADNDNYNTAGGSLDRVDTPKKDEENGTSGGAAAAAAATSTGADASEPRNVFAEKAVDLGIRLGAMYTHTNYAPPVVPRSRVMADAVGTGADDRELLDVDPDAPHSGEINIEGQELHEMNYAEPLPSGSCFASLHKIRQTISSYADKVSEPNWFATFKLATVQALRRRLVQHRDSIMGKASFEVQLTFLQLEARVDALVTLYAAMKKWLESHADATLTATLKPFSTLLSHLIVRELPLARDLTVTLSYGLFQGMLEKKMSVSNAIANFDVQIFDIMEELRGEGGEAAAAGAIDEAAAPADANVKEEMEEGDDGTQPTGPAAKKARHRRTKQSDLTSKAGDASSAHYFTTMVSEGFRTYVKSQPNTVHGEVGLFRSFLEDVCSMSVEFEKKRIDLERVDLDAISSYAE